MKYLIYAHLIFDDAYTYRLITVLNGTDQLYNMMVAIYKIDLEHFAINNFMIYQLPDCYHWLSTNILTEHLKGI